MKYSIFIFLLLLLNGCVNVEETLPVLDLSKDGRVFPLEEMVRVSSSFYPKLTDETGLNNLVHVEVLDGEIYCIDESITDDHALYAFDENGNLKWKKYANQYGAPGDFISPSDLFIQGDTICLLDPIYSRVVKFDLAGRFLKNVLIHEEVYSLYTFQNGKAIGHRGNQVEFSGSKSTFNIVWLEDLWNSRLSPLKVAVSIPTALWDKHFDVHHLFPGAEPNIALASDDFKDTVFQINENAATPLFTYTFDGLNQLKFDLESIGRTTDPQLILPLINSPNNVTNLDVLFDGGDYLLISWRQNQKRKYLKWLKKSGQQYIYEQNDKALIFGVPINVNGESVWIVYNRPQYLKDFSEQAQLPKLYPESQGELNPVIVKVPRSFWDNL
ncbi:MAG: 6-bladed beta-propeller [Saprospiraceae bacterium]|nr:6-bladed beta-propeller [Saprospiraceae bacterium]